MMIEVSAYRTCACCKKIFYVPSIDDWAYISTPGHRTRRGESRRKWFCSWRCLRENEKKKEKKKRYNLRLMWIADFDKWLSAEPPMWRVFAWRRWKRERPVWMAEEGE